MSGWGVLIVVAAAVAGPAGEQQPGYSMSAADGIFQCAVLAQYGSELREELEPEVLRLARAAVPYARRAAQELAIAAKARDKADFDSLTDFYLEMPADFIVGVFFKSASTTVDSTIYRTLPWDGKESEASRRTHISLWAAEEFDRRDCNKRV